MVKAPPDWLKEIMPFGFQQMPGGKPGDLMGNLMYSMGQPGVFSSQGYQSIYQNQMNQNLQNGQPPFTGFPDGWGDSTGTGTGTDQETEPEKKNRLRGMPQWWQEWWRSQGKYGGVRRNRGLLDD